MDKNYAKDLLNKTTHDYNLIAKQFSEAREDPWKEFSFLFKDFLSSRERVLDIGCGNGRFFELCKGKVSYFGIDSSEELIKVAKKRYPEANFQVADALNIPFPAHYFDKVYSIAVLQHIPGQEFREQFLKEAKRVLRPGGFLLLTVWNLWRWNNIKLLIKNTILKLFGVSKLDFKDFFLPATRQSLFKNFYYHAFTKRELEGLVRKIGFKIEKSGLIIMSSGKKPHSNFYIVLSNQT
jgi:ubiquinone/menaquinone biosynthesis C-methylase UbiE